MSAGRGWTTNAIENACSAVRSAAHALETDSDRVRRSYLDEAKKQLVEAQEQVIRAIAEIDSRPQS